MNLHKKEGGKSPSFIILRALAVLIGIGAAFAFFAWRYINTRYDVEEPAWLYLHKGTTREQLAAQLDSVLGSTLGSRTYNIYKAAASDSARIYGAYRIEPGTTAKDIAKRLVNHRQTPVKVTFNNIRTMEQLGERIAAQMDFAAEEFAQACAEVLPTSGFTAPEQYPAAFLPDTYEFYWTTPAEDVVAKLLEYRNNFWTDERRSQVKALGLTPVQFATIASIAEEETNNAEERGTVGRLYINRVQKGMPLQADPTVKFALGDFSLRRITAEHLKVDSPYNTYKHAGLPPGPIRIADKATLLKILSAPAHSYIYMCAQLGGTGRHNFATNYADHQANARAYRQWLDGQGIH